MSAVIGMTGTLTVTDFVTAVEFAVARDPEAMVAPAVRAGGVGFTTPTVVTGFVPTGWVLSPTAFIAASVRTTVLTSVPLTGVTSTGDESSCWDVPAALPVHP